MNEFELRAAYDQLIAARTAGRARCPAPEDLLRLAAGEGAESERLTWLEHVSTCRACRRELDLARAVVEAGTALVARRPTVRTLAWAAAIVLLVGGTTVWQAGLLSRDVTRGAGSPVVLIAPSGQVTLDQARRLVWRAVPGAARYEAELLDGAGGLVFATGTADTVAAVPVTTTLAAGAEYHWRVTALLTDGRRVRSVAESLRVLPAP
jgi:hypothetical protein